jgi:hypothetical protein
MLTAGQNQRLWSGSSSIVFVGVLVQGPAFYQKKRARMVFIIPGNGVTMITATAIPVWLGCGLPAFACNSHVLCIILRCKVVQEKFPT